MKRFFSRADDFYLRHQVKVRFLLVGIVNTIIGLAVFPLLFFGLSAFELHYLIILTLSQIVSVTWAFGLAKYVVFRSKGPIEKEYGRFLIFHGGIFIVNLMVLPIMVELIYVPVVWAQAGFAVTVILSSYFWQSRITFSQQSTNNT